MTFEFVFCHRVQRVTLSASAIAAASCSEKRSFARQLQKRSQRSVAQNQRRATSAPLTMLIPTLQLERELKERISLWETEHGKPFLVFGVPYLDGKMWHLGEHRWNADVVFSTILLQRLSNARSSRACAKKKSVLSA